MFKTNLKGNLLYDGCVNVQQRKELFCPQVTGQPYWKKEN